MISKWQNCMAFCDLNWLKMYFISFQVEVLDIAYAKTAKKVDVKRLKASMWNIMSRPEEDKVRPVDPQVLCSPVDGFGGVL